MRITGCRLAGSTQSIGLSHDMLFSKAFTPQRNERNGWVDIYVGRLVSARCHHEQPTPGSGSEPLGMRLMEPLVGGTAKAFFTSI